MITVNSGKIMIPRKERFVGFAGDNLHKTIQFYITPAERNCTYNLILSFSDNSVRIVPLTVESIDDGVLLSWEIRSRHIPVSGLVWAQIKVESANSDTEYYTGKNFFILGDPGDHSESDTAADTSFEERVLSALHGKLPYIGSDNYWYVYSEDAGDYVRSVMAGGSIMEDCVPATRMVGTHALSQDISAQELAEDVAQGNVYSYYLPSETTPGRIVYRRSDGTSHLWTYINGTWEAVATANSSVIQDLMGLYAAPVDDPSKFSEIPIGQIFRCQGVLYRKNSEDSYFAFADGSKTYTKAQVDALIPDVPTKVSELHNDSGYLTEQQVTALIETAIGGIENGAY